jgi:hypothetical protein
MAGHGPDRGSPTLAQDQPEPCRTTDAPPGMSGTWLVSIEVNARRESGLLPFELHIAVFK